MEKSIQIIEEQTQSLTITTPEQLQEAGQLMSEANAQLKAVKKEKEKITKPIQDALKAERARWRPLETRLQESVRIIKDAIKEYKQGEAVRVNELAEKVASGEVDIYEASRGLSNEKVAGISYREVTKVEITKKSSVPDCYKTVDIAAVQKALESGVEVKGAKLMKEKIVVNR